MLVDAGRAGRPPPDSRPEGGGESCFGVRRRTGTRRSCGRWRVAEVIEWITGVRYHPGHVWRSCASWAGRCSGPGGLTR